MGREYGADDLAQADFDVFTDTTANTPASVGGGFNHWIAIRPLEGDITPTLLGVVGGDALTSQTLTKDVVYQGRFNTCTLAAGKCIAYRSNT